MCVVSMIMDHHFDKWSPRSPVVQPPPLPPVVVPQITPQEVDEFRKLLDRARQYDREHNQPECELESKKERLRKLAEELGVRISFEPQTEVTP